MAILDIFIGVPQSKYAAMATLAAVLAVAVAMLMGKDSVSMGQKFVVMLVMFLFALPGLLLSLFQLTCLVTGSGPNKWCGVYAWIGTIISFLWALVVITIVVISIKRGTSVEAELAAVEGFSDMKAAAQAARKMADKAAAEYFADGDTTMPDMPADTVPPKTEAEKKAEESMMLGEAAPGPEGPAGEDMPPPMAQPIIPDGTVSSMPSPGDNIVLPEGFVGAVAMKKMEGFYPKAAAPVVPSAPETFTSCGAPLAF